MAVLQLTGIEKSFDSNRVLQDINLTINDGEFVVIVGPSGCGKSTLLRVIAGLEDPDSGEVKIDDVVINDMLPAKRDFSMVFQSYALYPFLTVAGNLAFGLQQKGHPKEEILRRVDQVSKVLSLDPYLERKPSELSGGQRQRVALGRALVRQPKLFLFDEPLSNLDAALRMNTRIEISRIHRSLGTTFIYVTHDQTEAMTLADTIVVMRDGKIEQVGAPMELYNKPVNRFVAGFLGSPAMNFIDVSFLKFPEAACVGLRPEHLRIAKSGRLKGTVLHYERLGSDTHLIVDLGREQQLIARLNGQHEFDLNEPIELDFDDANAHLFDDHAQRMSASKGRRAQSELLASKEC